MEGIEPIGLVQLELGHLPFVELSPLGPFMGLI